MRTLTIGIDNSCGQIPFISFLCHEQRVDIILDSGSQGNVIKFEVLPLNVQINYSDQILLKGISEELLLALGNVHLKIFDQLIKFYVVRNEVQIPRSGILGIEFLSKNNVIIEFDKNNLHIGDHTLPLKKNGYCPMNVKVDKIFNINSLNYEQTLPLIDVLNRHLENVGQFLLDTGSEGNLIKISSLPPDCEIDISKKVYLKGINEELKLALGTAELTIFGYTTEFQIVPEDFPIPCEGLLGTEYFETSHSLLDFGNKFLKVGEKYSAFRNRKTLNPKNNSENKEILLSQELEDETIKWESNEFLEEWDPETSLAEQYQLQVAIETTGEDF